MPRLPRPTDDGLIFHALNRGNNRGDVFFDDDDRRAFLDALARTKERYPFRLLGYCLMTNHVHLLLQPTSGQSLSRIMQSLTVAHTWRYHKRWKTFGHVWQGRFKSPVIQDDAHLLSVLRYIETNPLRARIVEDLLDYAWSSFAAHANRVVNPLVDNFPEFDALGSTPASRARRWRSKVIAPFSDEELSKIRQSSRTGRPLGLPEWVAAKADLLGIELNPRPKGRPRKTDN